MALARHDPQKALAQVDPKNGHHLAKVISAIGTEDPDLAISYFENSSEYYRKFAIGGIITGLFKRDHAEALNFAYKHRSEKYNFTLGQHLQKWAAHDPNQAFAWALAHPETHKNHLARLAPILLNCDPEFFAQEFEKFPTGEVRTQLLQAQATHLAQIDPRSALTLADRQSPDLREILLKEIGKSVIHEHPDLALEILSRIVTQDIDQAPAPSLKKPKVGTPPIWTSDWVKTVVQAYPQSVMEFANAADSQPDTFPTNSVNAMKAWLKEDTTSARNWLIGQAPGHLRDHLTSQTTHYLVDHDFQNYPSNLALPNQIQNPELRQQTLNNFFNIWLYNNEEGLENYLKDNTLTPEQQKAYDQRGYN